MKTLMTFFSLVMISFSVAKADSNDLAESNISIPSTQDLSVALTNRTEQKPETVLQNGKLVSLNSFESSEDFCYFYSPDTVNFSIQQNFHLEFVFKVATKSQNMISLHERVDRGYKVESG